MKHAIDPDIQQHLELYLTHYIPELKPSLENFMEKAFYALKNLDNDNEICDVIEYLSTDTIKRVFFNYNKQSCKNIAIFQKFFDELESLLNEALDQSKDAQDMFVKIQTITYCFSLNLLYKTVSSHAQTEYVFGSEHLLTIVHRINHDYDDLVNRGLLDEIECSFSDDMFSLIWYFCLESKAPEDEKFNTFMSFLDGHVSLTISEGDISHTYQLTEE